MSLVVNVAAEFSHEMEFSFCDESIRNVYVCTVYCSAPCNSVCWQIFVDAILAIFVNHHTSEQ